MTFALPLEGGYHKGTTGHGSGPEPAGPAARTGADRGASSEAEKGNGHVSTERRLPHLRRRQPHVRDHRRVHEVPAGRVRGLIKYVEVNGRTKIAVSNVISDYIPNPTFEVVAAPGAQEEYFKEGNPEGKSRREIMGKPIRSLPAYRDPEPRLKLMDELGHRPCPDVADPGQPARGAPARRSAGDARRDPRPQPVDARALDLQLQDRIFPTPVVTSGSSTGH